MSSTHELLATTHSNSRLADPEGALGTLLPPGSFFFFNFMQFFSEKMGTGAGYTISPSVAQNVHSFMRTLRKIDQK